MSGQRCFRTVPGQMMRQYECPVVSGICINQRHNYSTRLTITSPSTQFAPKIKQHDILVSDVLPPSKIDHVVRQGDVNLASPIPKWTTTIPHSSPPHVRYWSYVDQRTSSKKRIVMKYIKDYDEAEKAVSKLTSKVIGFDLEWRPFKGPMSVDLVQICDEKTILLIHTIDMDGTFPNEIIISGRFPSTLKTLLEDPTIIKTGVNIKNDASRLAKVYSVWPAGLLELGRFAQAVDSLQWESMGITRTIISLERLAQTYLDKPIHKGPVSLTDWGKSDLLFYQKLYAANDCYSSWKIFQALDKLRRLSDSLEDIPPLIDSRDVWDDKVKADLLKTRRRLVRAGRGLIEEGNKCLRYLNQIRKIIAKRNVGI